MARPGLRWGTRTSALWTAAALASGVLSANVLTTTGFTNCNTTSSIIINKNDITYDSISQTVTFDVAGTSTKEQKVMANLTVVAYGYTVYHNSFDPCEAGTKVANLCPVPSGSFSAKGTQDIGPKYAGMVPSIAFQIPDIAAQATLNLNEKDTGEAVGCVESDVSNGKTASVPSVSYIAAGICGAALMASGFSAASSALTGGGHSAGPTSSPSFTEVVGVLQGWAMNGMLSVNHPSVYRSFTKNFGFSAGLIPWVGLQKSIDGFRNATGGNLTDDSIQFVENATLVFQDGSTARADSTVIKRELYDLALIIRDVSVSQGNATEGSGASSTVSSMRAKVSGIEAFAESLTVPSSNVFMTVLLLVAIVIGIIIVGILLIKVILEAWALFGNFPKGLTGFRKHYWRSIARTITQLILLLYSIWVMYCIYQFAKGDSWAAKLLAGLTLALFTGVLGFFGWRIYQAVQKMKQADGDASALYDNKEYWIKYSIFYESYKKDYWWLFIPVIVYMFAKGCVQAAGDGHGMGQTIVSVLIETCMLILLLWSKPFERRSTNIINISIQVVRVVSVACILVFVEEFGIAQSTQTITGVVIIVIQSALTGILAILIIVNAIISCVKDNPHRKRRKEAEKQRLEGDAFASLDAKDSMMMHQKESVTFSVSKISDNQPLVRGTSPDPYENYASESTTKLYSPLSHQQQPTLPNFNNFTTSQQGGGYPSTGFGGHRG